MPSTRKRNPRRRRAVFIDRDGVLNEEVDYLARAEELRMIPGAAEAVGRLREAGFKVIVVSNQSGVARGYFTRKDLRAITARLHSELRAAGAKVDAVYYCCHGPDAGCPCRKPGLALLQRAASRFRLDLLQSYFVGDTTTDVKTARAAGCRAVLVRTGKAGRDGKFPAEKADRVAADLGAAAAWILARTGPTAAV